MSKVINLFPPVLDTPLAKATKGCIKESRLLAGLSILEKNNIKLTPANNNERKIKWQNKK